MQSEVINIQVLKNEDLDKLIQLIKLYENVFEMENFVMPSEKYLQLLLNRRGTTFLAALINEQIVGGLTAHDLPSTYFEANEVYVYDLAVAKKYQRKGIGKKLLLELSKLCKIRNEKEFFLQADIDDERALAFYHSTGGIPESVIHFSYNTEN